MASDTNLTIQKNVSFEMVIKKSRFICSLARIKNEDDAKRFINQVANENHKANHNCFAYLIGPDDHIQRESDNGEPSGTAGVPILQALQMEQLHDVCAVVTRYFGGIKLGAGGLIRAYSNVTTGAIHETQIVNRIMQSLLTITVNYSEHDSLTYYLKQHNLEVDHEDYGVKVAVTIFVDQEQKAAVQEALTNRFNDQLSIKEAGQRIHEVPYNPSR